MYVSNIPYCWFVHVPLLFFCTGHWFDLQNQPDSQNGNKISSTTILQHYPEYVCVILNTDGISLICVHVHGPMVLGFGSFHGLMGLSICVHVHACPSKP